MSHKCIQHFQVRFSEIVRVSGDDDEIANERSRCDQAAKANTKSTGLLAVINALDPVPLRHTPTRHRRRARPRGEFCRSDFASTHARDRFRRLKRCQHRGRLF